MRTFYVLLLVLALTSIFSFACTSSNGDTPPDNGGTNATPGTQTTDGTPDTQPEVPTNENATPQIGDPSTFSADVQTDLPEGWRQDVPLLVGFQLDEFRPQGDGMMAICSGNLDIDTATLFYGDLENWQKSETPQKPWITEGDARRITYIRDNQSLSINLYEQEGTLKMTILVVQQAPSN
jgi:hypothetical protein